MKYYTAFVYSVTTPENPIHCTHVYFGEISEYTKNRMIELLDGYFRPPNSFPHVAFTRPEMFGEEKQTRVLLPVDEDFAADVLLSALRDILLAFRGDEVQDYGSYRPHVTTELDQVDAPFSGYAFMSGNEIIRFWK